MFILVDNPIKVSFIIALATTRSRLYIKNILTKTTIKT